MGYKYIKWTPERDKLLIDVMLLNKSNIEIEIALGCSYLKCYKRYKELISKGA